MPVKSLVFFDEPVKPETEIQSIFGKENNRKPQDGLIRQPSDSTAREETGNFCYDVPLKKQKPKIRHCCYVGGLHPSEKMTLANSNVKLVLLLCFDVKAGPVKSIF